MKKILFVFRKKNPLFFSIERVFESMSNLFVASGWTVSRVEAPHYSSGIPSIIRNILSLRKEKADIYHVTGDIHYAVFAFPRKKTVLTIHDCVNVIQSKGLRRWVMLHLFVKWPVSYAQVVTTISEQSKKEIVELSGCDPSKIVVTYNPVRSSINFNKKEFNADCPNLLFIGSTPNKNLGRVLDSLKGLNCVLEIVGKVGEEFLQVIKLYGIKAVISDRLTEEQLNEKYRKADVLVFPTLYEGFGLPILEAQQAGVPVLTSNRGPMDEVAGKGACLVDPEKVASIREGLEKILKDSAFRNSLIQNGLENCKRFQEETIRQKYLEVYNLILI